MKILPISRNTAACNTVHCCKYTSPVLTPAFTAGDIFDGQSLRERRLAEIKSSLDETILPYFETNKDKFIQVAKIGYDSQEKLGLIRSYETKLMQKKLNAQDNPEFAKVGQLLGSYEKYQENIRVFERLAEFVQTRPMYSTPQILNAIEKNRSKIYRDSDEFEKLTPLYERFSDAKANLISDMNNIASKNNSEFSEQIQKLDNMNKEAILLFMISDYQECNAVLKEYDVLLREGTAKTPLKYDVYERIDRLNYAADKLAESIDKKNCVVSDMENFIRKNKNYKKEIPSKEEIDFIYNKLLKDADKAIEVNSQTLIADLPNFRTEISPRIADRAIKLQNKVIRNIEKLIQQEKEKAYNNPQF